MNAEEILDDEIDIVGHSERNEEIPHARSYKVRIDCEAVRVDTSHPTGEALLRKVHKRSCAFELIAEFVHCENEVIEPGETVDLRRRGLKGFSTAHKEVVTIFIQNAPYQIERGEHTVSELLQKVGKTPEGYVLLEEKNGPPLPLPPNLPVNICGCEVFYTQPQSGGSS
jgi:hypothetical protein